MGLTSKEKKMLADLQKKESEPDAPPIGRSVSVHVDLSDPDQVARAVKFGFLPADEEEAEEEEVDEEETPKRRGYFPDK